MTQLSPFSAAHKWKLYWKGTYNDKAEKDMPTFLLSKSQKRAVYAISEIGVIGRLQLLRIFLNNDRKKLKGLLTTGSIKEHLLKKNNQEIPIYTIGTERKYNEMEVVQRLLFFQLYEKMSGLFPGVRAEKTKFPYVGSFVINKSEIKVLVLRENNYTIRETIKRNPNEQFILICEQIFDLKPFNDLLSKCNVRVTTDQSIRGSENLFYLWLNGEWVHDDEWTRRSLAIQ